MEADIPGAVTTDGRYSLVTVTDDGVNPPVFDWKSYKVNNTTGVETLFRQHTDPMYQRASIALR